LDLLQAGSSFDLNNALRHLAERDAFRGRQSVEVDPNHPAQWHIGRTLPGEEFKALQFLSQRKVGCFLPRFHEDVKVVAGEALKGRRIMFPGLIFIFTWDILGHWRLIRDCPGMSGIMVDGGLKPVVVPDHAMDRIQALQYNLLEPKPKRKRYRSHRRELDFGEVNIGVLDARLSRMSDDERNRALMSVLRLA
jgi:transcription antitermination factor NusG